MTKTISGTALRDRLLARLASKDAAGWVEVLAVPSHRDLLGLIGRERPESIGRLSELAGRAQPNVSRSLSALVEAGLVEVETDGRRSIPRLTAFGRDKAGELKLLGEPSHAASPIGAAVVSAPASGPHLGLSVSAEDGGPMSPSSDCIRGRIAVRMQFRDGHEFVGVRHADLVEAARHLTEHWWRILYRRDAPFSIGEYVCSDPHGETSAACVINSTGRRIELLARRKDADGVASTAIGATFAVDAFADHLLDGMVRPVVAMLRAGLRYDRPLDSDLSRIEEARAYPDEFSFCKAAGALGISPVGVSDDVAASIRRLVREIDDEEARLDFASALLAEHLDVGFDWIAHELGSSGRRNRLHGLPDLRGRCAIDMSADAPWKVGISLAKTVRERIGLAIDRSVGGVAGLAHAMGAEGPMAFGSEPPASLLAFQSTRDGDPEVVIADSGPIRSAFILARAVGDYIAFGSRNACVTELYTERQAIGRAFAAELLAPSQAVVAMVDQDNRLPHAIAAHFGVSPGVVYHQYRNNSPMVRIDA